MSFSFFYTGSSPINITELAMNLTNINNHFVSIIHLDLNTITLKTQTNFSLQSSY
ncbi:hypothetical protein CROQUDRAFT_639087 [Cronartium quercuum f. sp. fusiforme G11]|uniref:Uncharacterized protein n=1 Tax=Cronartium quercuum f. sp. fusiforme G11 TaxID=708437 RepID=A0A9P6NET4_9BASI|nr:hypothetical protein CROQUDRAFT_639087 [Cronartium quercuum f. sp. fusiforme G11]